MRKREENSMKDMENVKKILEKYRKGAAIESLEDEAILGRYASTGMVHFGFNYKTGKGEAKLTDRGKWFVKQL